MTVTYREVQDATGLHFAQLKVLERRKVFNLETSLLIAVHSICRYLYSSKTKPLSDGDLVPEQEMARKNKELADKTALQNELMRGEIVRRKQVVNDQSAVIVNLKNNLLSVGNRVADIGMTAKSSGELEEIISDGIRDALNGLSEIEGIGSSLPGDVGSDSEQLEAASEDDDQPVGRSRATSQSRIVSRAGPVEDEPE